ncbi:DUF1484 family protein [Cupriavidus oxalaticus]|jgi:hypothetical protein|uniref:DUF1484 family protein n=1 Tax=Cupriavidus oxalaticus TaxID=96344 RepID=A0A375GGW9_9BURK|nr:DUF1484 family protein [Cupriavidus oxalaticus]QEZ44911.1 DUF1484 family protein [Cupriavidus oxalaticus]QRQ83716.1 DUF1484 family protein [Cupriavidus oxalaticus]QRQ92195.1 DUF1484 family protein [Cupriavidus oxalaticus]WQD86804.1 DUF1484 family protein [Cupriavidus oxalaticus]SPC05501.1 conserved hypothetical protein [Cupriavidus oxalaticus]
MQSTSRAPQEPTLIQDQAELASSRAKADRTLARRLAGTAPPSFSKTVSIEEHIVQASDDLLRISAGFQSVLTLLDLQSDTRVESIGLHALLLPLKQQIDKNVDRLQALV